MATITQKSIVDDITILATKFAETDDSRIDADYLADKVDDVRAELIPKIYDQTGVIDPSWLSDLGMLQFYDVNFADDSSITVCDCKISKTTIPQIITLNKGGGNQDLGLYSVISACGKTRYYPMDIAKWSYIPQGTEYGLFHYYSRVNTALYVNKSIEKLRILALLARPLDGSTKNSAPIASGSIVSGTVYIVKYGQVIYNGSAYQANATFTGTATTTFTGNGSVYLYSQVSAFSETDPYPVNADLKRMIVQEILVKEFGIERQIINDVGNDSKDDANKP